MTNMRITNIGHLLLIPNTLILQLLLDRKKVKHLIAQIPKRLFYPIMKFYHTLKIFSFKIASYIKDDDET